MGVIGSGGLITWERMVSRRSAIKPRGQYSRTRLDLVMDTLQPQRGAGMRSRIDCRIRTVADASPLCMYVLLTTRWAQQGTNRALTSSGVTYSRFCTIA